jgi:hypothetical protein
MRTVTQPYKAGYAYGHMDGPLLHSATFTYDLTLWVPSKPPGLKMLGPTYQRLTTSQNPKSSEHSLITALCPSCLLPAVMLRQLENSVWGTLYERSPDKPPEPMSHFPAVAEPSRAKPTAPPLMY